MVISEGVLRNDPETAQFTWNGRVNGLALIREVAVEW